MVHLPRIAVVVAGNASMAPRKIADAARAVVEPVFLLDEAEVVATPVIRQVAEALDSTGCAGSMTWTMSKPRCGART